MRMIIIAGSGYAAFDALRDQVKRRMKDLDRQIDLINTTQPLSTHDQLLIKRRMKFAKVHENLTEKINEIVDRLPMPQFEKGGLC